MKKYIVLSALSAALLMTGCTKDTYDKDEKKPGTGVTIAVGFTAPGIAQAVAASLDPNDEWEAPAAPATRAALPANATVRVVAYTTASGNPLKANYVAEQTYYMNNGNLEPCTVNTDGSFSAADADASLLLESANYDFYAITPALPLNADKATLSVPNGVDYASSVTTNVAAAETVALTQMERKCVRLELSVQQPTGMTYFETLTVKSARLSALSAARTVTIGSDIPAGTGSEVFTPVFTNPSPAVAAATVYLLPVSALNLNATYDLSAKLAAEAAAKDLTVKSLLPNLTLEKGKSYTLTGIVRDGLYIGDLVLSPIGIIAAQGATVTVKSPYAPAGNAWTASLMNPFTGVSLGAVSGSGSGCSVPVVFAVNPNNSNRSVTLMADAPWAETPRMITMTQAGSTMGTLSQSPGNNISAEGGATVTVSTTATTPELPWTATLSNTTGFSISTTSGTGNLSIPVTVALNPTNATRSTTLTAKAKDGNTSGAVTITQAASSLVINSPATTTPAKCTDTSLKFKVTGTKGLTLYLFKEEAYSSADFSNYPNPKEVTCTGGEQEFSVSMDASDKPIQKHATYAIQVTNSGSTGLSKSFEVYQAANPRAKGYITKAGDETGLPPGMYCVGMYGGYNGSSYTKALYVDKRGANSSGMNPGNDTDYKGTVPKGDYSDDGLNNPNHPYCNTKGMYLPGIGQLSAIYRASLSGEYSFVSGWYWSSTITGSYGYTVQRGIDFSNGNEVAGNHTLGSGTAHSHYVRCVREW